MSNNKNTNMDLSDNNDNFISSNQQLPDQMNETYIPPIYPSSSTFPYEMVTGNVDTAVTAVADHQHYNFYSSFRTTNSNLSNKSVVYVYELPYNIRKSICDLLDADNSWRELGGRYMGFNDTQLTLISHALYRSASPTNELLTKWEASNAKVSHLFIYLAQMKHHRAMYYLLPFVKKKLRMLYETTDVDQINHFQSFCNSKAHHLSPISRKETNFKHSTLKNLIGENSKFYEHYKNRDNGHPDDETLINLTSIPKTPGNKKRTAQDSKEIDFLLKIDDFKISHKELLIATNDFSKDNVLGSGGFGTVFIGEWKGTKVAIKKLKGCDNLTQALTELRILNCCRIDNILPLYAVALDGPEPCLVYQYMPNGSLEDRLLCKNNTPPLTWFQRAKIGEGVARGLNYLHTLKGNPFVHGDVKSANILLDPLFEPKLGDFGLARQVVTNNRNENSIYTHCTVSSVNGTSVYLPAEYLRQKILSPAVDVYSYGIVILEMATGRRAYDGKKLLINSVEDEYSKVQNASININSINEPTCSNENSRDSLMDKRIANLPEGRHLFNYLLELGRRCAHKMKSKRPTMIQILEYYNQCRATECIHKLCDKVIQNKIPLSKANISKTNLKTPIELQLWYDFVRKSCGTLSEIVFENFDAQVTKFIEDLACSTDSDKSTFCLDLLLNSKNKLLFIKSKENQETSEQNTEYFETSSENIPYSLSKIFSNDSENNLSQFLRIIHLEKSESQNDTSNEIQISENIDSYNEYSVPFIPLLTALGFNTLDINGLIEK